MEETLQKVQELLIVYGLKILGAIVILVVGQIVAKTVTKLVKRLMEKSKVDGTLVGFVGNLVHVALMTFVIIAALGQLDVKTASFVAVLGAAGLAVGLALQGSLSNFAAGVLILLFRPFKSGDLVEAAGTLGVIEEIHIFTTVLKTPDNKKVIVPNSSITGGNVTNYTANDTRRVDMVVGVGYGDDLKKVRSAIEAVLNENELILKDPEPTIGVVELGDNSVNVAVRPWAKTDDYWTVFFGTLEALKVRFDAEGISIPYPQRDVHLFQESAS
jgi:small conductance mechanosensitive channel